MWILALDHVESMIVIYSQEWQSWQNDKMKQLYVTLNNTIYSVKILTTVNLVIGCLKG